jgi:hypothetical protein
MTTLQEIEKLWQKIKGDTEEGQVVCNGLIGSLLQDHPDFVGLPADERRGVPVYSIGSIGSHMIKVSTLLKWSETEATVTIIRKSEFDYANLKDLI